VQRTEVDQWDARRESRKRNRRVESNVMFGKMEFHTRMVNDPGSACDECGMPGDLCTCDAMEACDDDYCKQYEEPPKALLKGKKK